MDEQQLKAAFAAFLLENPAEPFAAALRLFPAEKDRGEACRVTFAWPKDPEVILEMERLKKDGVYNKSIPTKEQVVEELWKLVQSDKVSPKDRGANARLVAEMLGFIKKTDDDESKRMPSAPVYKVVTE